MTLAILYLLLPATLAWVLLGRAALLSSRIAALFASWFLGEFAATLAVYAVAAILAPHTEGVLRKAVLVVLTLTAAGLLLARRSAAAAIRSAVRALTSAGAAGAAGQPRGKILRAGAGKFLFLLACAAFAFFFYRPHLAQTADSIYRSPVYWDLNIHAPLIQNFAFGDNFPAQNESFAGAPETYHFFFDLLVAVPASLGVSLSDSLLLVPAASLFALLGLLVGFAEELAGGAAAGILAVLLAITSSSLRFLDYFGSRPLAEALGTAFWNRQHPYLFSFVAGNPFAYNGTMFNLFYFLAERQLVFASGFLLAAVLLFQTRGRWHASVCAAAGVALGLFCFWHLFVTISIGAALVWLLATSGERRKTAAVLAGMAVVGVAFLLWTHSLMRPEWFKAAARPAIRLDPGFATRIGGPRVSMAGALGYWAYAWGLKAPAAAAGLLVALRRRRRLFDAIACVVLPGFLLVNTVRLFPLSVYDNHKWLRPMNLFVDLAAAWFLVELWRSLPARRETSTRAGILIRAAGAAAAAAALLLMTLSGALELVPFLRSRPTIFYASYPTALTAAVRSQTAPRSVFVSPEAKALHLAGRKLFVGNDADEKGAKSLIASAGLDVERRKKIERELAAAPAREDFCRLVAENGIDWVEVDSQDGTGSGAGAASPAGFTAPGFSTASPGGRPLRYLDARRFCASPAPGRGTESRPITPPAAPR